jgi:hypothetical protein
MHDQPLRQRGLVGSGAELRRKGPGASRASPKALARARKHLSHRRAVLRKGVEVALKNPGVPDRASLSPCAPS